ncbi:hypothetical protein MHO82_21135 [Vibrio sp. Of7-15]|uniref:hypothetical protein n=1 Tax=Vibrio sp. Of7-15 TaxID=2724879 RepID=UPI001EF319EB|nr:hypothetical protein [Vibrio sp. Of7-15]MCG7499374.1 hypothetical protein [Vibrio sp. Of7-15]
MNFVTSVLLKTLYEVLKSLVTSLSWTVIVERFATRLVIWGLEKLKNLTTNDVVQDTVDDVIASLQGKRLKEIPPRE